MVREEVIAAVARHVAAVRLPHPTRVAIDGITAAGKTTFARGLSEAVEQLGRPSIYVSMDGFHHPRARRHRQGRRSADGYYEDAYDFAGTVRGLLAPLGPAGDLGYRRALIDLETDEPSSDVRVQAPAEAVLVVDGSFLQRPEIVDAWDLVVYLDVDFDAALSRGVARDAARLGGADAARELFEQRYHAACRRYLSEVPAADMAAIVVDHNDPLRPAITKMP